MAFDLDSHGPEWRPAFEAVAATVGGRVVSVERQARWRPVFWVGVERPGGELVPVCFRGARTEQGEANTIRHEYDCLRVLEKHGIPVPKIYGYCEKPEGVIMQKVPGRPDLATADSPEAFESARDQFIETLARIHSLLPRDPIRAHHAARDRCTSRPSERGRRVRPVLDLVPRLRPLAYLVRRLKREEAILAPAQRDLVGARMQRLRLDCL